MKNVIKELSWDSEFFGKNIAEIEVEDGETIEGYNLPYDLIVVKQYKKFTPQITDYKEEFCETKVIFCKNIIQDNLDHSEICDTDEFPKDFRYFTDLAYESGKMSRFQLDKRFGAEKFRELYDLWVINSLNKKFAEKVFYVSHEGAAIGFVTLQKTGNLGKIGLIATHPKYQGQGLGRKLLEHVENYCIKNNLRFLEIPTQKENINACKFYEKMGYTVKEEIILKHFWKKKNVVF